MIYFLFIIGTKNNLLKLISEMTCALNLFLTRVYLTQIFDFV